MVRRIRRHAFVYNGIDRVNNAKGYVTGNVVSCCKNCNLMKKNMSADAFIAHVRRIASYQEG